MSFLYRCYATDGRLIYIGATADVHNRANVHWRQSPFGDRIAEIRYRWVEDIATARRMERDAIAAERPLLNRRMNPDYVGRPLCEQTAKFLARLATVPVAPDGYGVRDERPMSEIVAELRACERMSA